MTVSIIAVNYNTYPQLNSFLDSVERSAAMLDGLKATIFIADNSTEKQTIDTTCLKHAAVKYLPLSNLGYFGGADAVLTAFPQAREADYVIISNVDVSYDLFFFQKLAKIQTDNSVAWIAPRIHSSFEQRDRNPKFHRYSRRKLSLMRLKFRFPLLNTIYNNTLYKRPSKNHPVPASQVYSAHGSVIILTHSFFKAYNLLNYPVFLFCEELYLAEQIAAKKMKVMYCPDLIVNDLDHASTSRIKWRSYCKANLLAVNYILDRYYR